jgi:deazaflavin-dependent oxidoreductase (nitroreductase family)
MEDYRQEVAGSMTYPQRGTLNRVIFKVPLIWWRMGLGPLLSHEALAGNKMLVLTTWGRKSQSPRHTMLSFVVAGERIYVCSGWGAKSDWYKNILANPEVTLQVGRRVYSARARRVREIDEFQQIAQEMFATGGDTHFGS